MLVWYLRSTCHRCDAPINPTQAYVFRDKCPECAGYIRLTRVQLKLKRLTKE